ncbi:pyridoxal phosphate-dependent aminotransferase [Candidatus Bathyarchaeota archaeon]|nr:MAG: pyridoxal phosphate-dependent aminotransferase [Candidatus Bathyarchaeota archaeon]
MLEQNLRKSKRASKLKVSEIRRLFATVRNFPDIINLGIGEPDFNPPKHVIEAAEKAMDEGKTHYSPTSGIPELLEAIAEKTKRDYNLDYNPETEVLVTIGATEAVFLALMATINPGDEVLVPDPGFVTYKPSVKVAEGTVVPIPLKEENDFRFNADSVRSLITKRSRILIINSPHNPTGSVLSYEDLNSIAKLAVEHDLIVISDEVYEKITYDGVKHYCVASFPGMRERTIVVNSFSKTYAMTGFRIGFAVGPEDIMSAMKLIHYYTVACVNSPTQYAALTALTGPQDFVSSMVREFDRRRKFVCKRINEIEGFSCITPKGAFYVFPNIKSFGMSSKEFARFLLEEAKVAAVPGTGFGRYGEGYLRLSYATSYEKLEEAMNRIERAVKKLEKSSSL